MGSLSRHCLGPTGLLLAVVAMVSQLALGTMVLPDDRPADPVAALDAAIVLCQAGQPPVDKSAPPRGAPQTTLCPLSVALELPAVILGPAPALPVPPAALASRLAPSPSVRAPPARAVMAVYPRGPPVLS